MNYQTTRSGNITAILLIIALVVGIASTVLIITISRTNPQTNTSASAPTDIKSLLPSTQSTPSAQPASFAAPQTAAQQVATSSTAISTVTNLSPGDIGIETALSTDRTTFVADFVATSFTPISLITYSISYTADASGSATAKNINGSFAPATVLVTGYKSTGYPYIRKSFTLGTCSGVTCTYDTNPRSFSVSASAKL